MRSLVDSSEVPLLSLVLILCLSFFDVVIAELRGFRESNNGLCETECWYEKLISNCTDDELFESVLSYISKF